MKAIHKHILALALILITLILTGCGGFFAEPSVEIVDVIQEPLTAEGYLPFYFLYADGSTSQTFMIPPGQAGAIGGDGRGIASINYEWDKDNHRTKLIVTYNDEGNTVEENPLYVYGITATEPEYDENGDPFFWIYYVDPNNPELTDDEKGTKIKIPRGIGLNPKQAEQLENGDWKLTLEWSTGESQTIVIPAGKAGEDGKGVDSITASMGTALDFDDEGNCLVGKYLIHIKSSEEGAAPQLFVLDPPPTSRWFEGQTNDDRDALETVKVGDFFLNTGLKIIYKAEEGPNDKIKWVESVRLGIGSEEEITVIFDWNDGSGKTYRSTRRLGSTFFRDDAVSDFPIPQREGYRFVGWFTDISRVNPEDFNGIAPFGPTTSILPSEDTDTLKLYAIWESTTFNVRFHLNNAEAIDAPDGFVLEQDGGPFCYTVEQNTYFTTNYDRIPVPTREGYTFMGWYTKPVDAEDLNVTMSPFTDLTPICSDLDLYAIWQAN